MPSALSLIGTQCEENKSPTTVQLIVLQFGYKLQYI